MLFEFFILVFFFQTAVILFWKYYKKGIPSHFWASAGFFILFLQQVAFTIWIILRGFPLPENTPLQLQGLVVFFALNLVGLSICGKIKEKPPIKFK